MPPPDGVPVDSALPGNLLPGNRTVRLAGGRHHRLPSSRSWPRAKTGSRTCWRNAASSGDGAARCKPMASRQTYRTMKSSASSQLTWRHVFESWDTWPARLWYCQWSWPSPPQVHLRHRGEILSKMRAGADAQRGRQYWQRPPQRQWLMPR